MRFVSAIITFVVLSTAVAQAAECTTRRSGSVVITTCGSGQSFSQCRSYRSGSVIKTSCR
jgi:hypothetical protein